MAEEREVKLAVSDDFSLPPLDGLAPGTGAVDRGVHLLEASYWDTAGMQLYRQGIGLRHRTTDGDRGTWTVKSGGRREGRAVVRDEMEVAGGPDTLPDDLAALLPAGLDSTLRPVATLRTERRLVDLVDRGGRRWAEVAEDRVAVLRDGRVVDSFREVEVEVTAPCDEAWVAAALDRLEAAGARHSPGTAKHTRALEALGLLPPAERGGS